MAADQSGLRWSAWPLAGAVGAGRHDALPEPPAGFTLTPSGQAELLGLEVPADAGSEQPG